MHLGKYSKSKQTFCYDEDFNPLGKIINVVAGISDRLNFFMKVNFQQLQGNNKGS